jgi:NAD(P)-dependent dehydrogenase (short-subunit alcohol dehydrogenase family)
MKNIIRALGILTMSFILAPYARAMDLQLDGKLALVTGSTGGIGYGIARGLLSEGATVIINGRSQESVDTAIKELKEQTGKTAIGFAGDMSKTEDIERLVKAHPGVEILVNNVGTATLHDFEEIPDKDWYYLFDLNVMSGVRLSRAYLPAMKQKNWGRIIFISSESAVQIPKEMVHYGMTKTAQLAVARGIAESVAGTGITVNAVLPGPTKTTFFDRMKENIEKQGGSVEQMEKEFIENARPSSLIKRFAEVDEVASMVVYLCSPLASATTGAAVRVDGGVVRSAF